MACLLLAAVLAVFPIYKIPPRSQGTGDARLQVGRVCDAVYRTRLLAPTGWTVIWKAPIQPGWPRSLGNVVSATFIYTPPGTRPSVVPSLSSTTLPHAHRRLVPLREPLSLLILLAVFCLLSASALSMI